MGELDRRLDDGARWNVDPEAVAEQSAVLSAANCVGAPPRSSRPSRSSGSAAGPAVRLRALTPSGMRRARARERTSSRENSASTTERTGVNRHASVRFVGRPCSRSASAARREARATMPAPCRTRWEAPQERLAAASVTAAARPDLGVPLFASSCLARSLSPVRTIRPSISTCTTSGTM